MEGRRIYKTLAIRFQSADELQGGTVEIDLGKYYDNNAVRIAKMWAFSTYEDVTAGSAPEEANCSVMPINIQIMQLPLSAVTVLSALGVAASREGFLIGGDRNGEFEILGDAILTSPNLDLLVTGYKRSPGGYPVEFRFMFWIDIQFEFNVDNLNEQIIEKILRE